MSYCEKYIFNGRTFFFNGNKGDLMLGKQLCRFSRSTRT